ncbi:liver-expressed antimicrobial peptide 2-like [Engraulis encrasicolus]|uniref:liver-expressed antimicrobial peptide 2-like n=1 Tax=Engraulis encrasicolus TaxID=184585 RepID=UPI002FCE80F9
MKTIDQRVIALSLLLTLFCAIQVRCAPVGDAAAAAAAGAADADVWAGGLLHRAKRSLLWRWNMLKPLGASCREHAECGTKYCRRHVCTFRSYSS